MRLPERLARKITREIERLAQVQAKIVGVEVERDKAPTPRVATERKRHQLLRLKGVGPALSSTLTRDVYYRQFVNRRQVASYIGITPSARPVPMTAARDTGAKASPRPAIGGHGLR